MVVMEISTQLEEVETSMQKKLHEIEEEVEIEKKKSQDCRDAIKKSIDSLCDLLNGEDILEEISPVLNPGGNDADGK